MITRKRCRLCQHENRDQLESDLNDSVISPDELDRIENWPSGTSAKHQRNHMGEYEKSSNPRCNICTSPMSGD